MRNQSRTILVFLALIALATYACAHPNYTGYSGAPGSKGYCASSCHGSSGGTIQVDGFPPQYVPGQTYTVTISHAGGSPIKQFNGSCRIGSGSENAGVIAAGTNTATYSTTSETNGIHLSAVDQESGTFQWTAPASETGDVTLYIAGHQGLVSGANTNLSFVSSEIATGVDENGSPDIPSGYKLSDNFPNPFNPSTSIAFDLPQRSHVTIDVFNLLGQEVARLVDEEYPAGSHTVTWNGMSSGGQTVPTGIYLYRLKAGNFIETKKMLLLK